MNTFFPTTRAAAVSYTCENMKKLGKGAVALSPSQISNMNTTEFKKCENTFGTITTWSADRLTALATIAKKVNIFCSVSTFNY